MKWIKKGLIYAPTGEDGWRNQFAFLPTPLLLKNGRLRVFVNMCEKNMVGRVGYVDVNPENPSEVYEVSEKPVLDIGKAGTFDDNGVGQIDMLPVGGKLYMKRRSFSAYVFCSLLDSSIASLAFACALLRASISKVNSFSRTSIISI